MRRFFDLFGKFNPAGWMLGLSFRVPVFRKRLAGQKHGLRLGAILFFYRRRSGFGFALRLSIMTLLFEPAATATAATTSAPATWTTIGLLIASAAFRSRSLRTSRCRLLLGSNR